MINGKRMTLLATTLFPIMLIGAGLAYAGKLEPSGPPGPTTQIPPAWSQKIAGPERFELVLDGAGVLDKETGLVWEQSPSTSTMPWESSFYHCNQVVEKGDRKGWHVPTVEQLASLVDPSQANPALPNDHPFSNVMWPTFYWTASAHAYVTNDAWSVGFSTGEVAHNLKTGSSKYVWCIRGGSKASD